MKQRETIFVTTALLIFVIVWFVCKSLIEAAQEVGDTSNNFNPGFRAILPAISILGVYALIYYGISLILAIKRKRSRNKQFDEK